MSKKLKKRIKRVAIGAVVYLIAVLLKHLLIPEQLWYLALPLFLAAYAVIGGDVVKKAVMNIGKGQVFDENFLMMVATVGAFFTGEFDEAVAVMLFYQVGECFQSYAVNKSRKSITGLMDIRPDYANVLADGDFTRTDPENVRIGDTILVKPGERIPLDGVVTKGSSLLDTKALTGESLPREVAKGDAVISGCVNRNGLLEIEVTKEYGQSTVAKILELVENAGSRKAEAENFITKFARYYTPIVVFCALALAILPPLMLGGGWKDWIYRALSFLVISCPCALVISIPLSFFGGLGGASKQGILIKGSNYLEALAQTEMVVMDKTGTLTKGNFAISRINPVADIGKAELLRLAAYAESFSDHPISQSICEAYCTGIADEGWNTDDSSAVKYAGTDDVMKAIKKEALPEKKDPAQAGSRIDKSRVSNVEELAGHGVKALVDGSEILAGNDKLMKAQSISYQPVEEAGTVIYLAKDGIYLGYLLIEDEKKPDAALAVSQLQKSGVKRIVMLTGDQRKVAEKVAGELGITEYFAELLPGDKVDRVEELFKSKSEKGKLVFVGDGINDAPVLARADIGIAMGGMGSDAAIEAADVVIMTDEPSKIAQAMRISKRTLAIVKQNIVFAIGVKVLVLLLAAVGIASMWAAVFADVGVAVIAILNAMRALKVK